MDRPKLHVKKSNDELRAEQHKERIKTLGDKKKQDISLGDIFEQNQFMIEQNQVIIALLSK